MSFGQREKEKEWAESALAVVLGWAMFLTERALPEDATEEDVLEAYPMKTFIELRDRGVELGLIEEVEDEEQSA